MSCESIEISFLNSEIMEFKSDNNLNEIFDNFQIFRTNGELCDICLTSGDMVVKAHRVVLAAACTYFKAMFNSGLDECQKGFVSLPTIPPDVLRLIIDFIYTGKITICSSNIQHLITAADMLQLGELATGCTEYLKTQLHPTNALGLFRFAEAYRLAALAEHALDYTRARWADVVRGEELLDVPASLLIELLSSEKLVVDDEAEVLRAALRWLGHEPESRKQHCVEVLRRVRLRLVGPHALEEALTNVQDPYMAGMLDLLKAVLASREPRERARRHLYVAGGVRHDLSRIDVLEALNTVERFDTCSRVWEEVAPMHFHRSAPGVAVIGNRLYAVGGRGSRNLLANGEAYDPVSNKWSRIADMSKPRRSFGLVAMQNKLYAFGGVGDLNRESSVEVYDPELDEWTVVGEMPEPRCGMGVVSYDGAAYLVGGSTQTQGYTNDLLHYNPVTGEWRRLAPLKHARGCTAAVVLDSRLYVVGGGAIPGDSDEFIPSNRVECYIFAKNEWEVIRCIREARVGCMAGAAGGVLVVAGGHCGVNVNDVITEKVELYDSWEKKWTEGPSLPHSRSFAGAAVL